MENYLDVANSAGMWLACSAIVVVVFFQAIRFTLISLRAGEAIGLTRTQMMTAFRTGFTTALVPSIAILLGLAVLIPSLGAPFPWMRLSVLGNVVYELMASAIAAREMGLESITQDPTGRAFATAVWVMCMGFLIPLIFVAFFTPKIKNLKGKLAGGDAKWMGVLSTAAFFGAVGYMVSQPLVRGGAPLVALLGGFLSVVVLGAIYTIGKQAWLKEWIVSMAIVGGMAAAGFGHALFGIGG
ncbi:MAG: DUF5058 family protein [Desulfobacterales bacterium]|nr:DUF5058 family protein [Desulfobacterales bacterium]